ncbi:MAG: hypothetical protein ACTHNU_12315 [Gaiellales bacterium]
MKQLAIAAVVAAVAVAATLVFVGTGGAASSTYLTVGAKNGAGVGFYSTGRVSCPSGYHMVGGGYFASAGVRVVASWPRSDRTWAVRGASADGSTHTYFIYVRCRS